MTLKVGQLVKLTEKSRFEEWEKLELAKIEEILVEYPQNQYTLYIISPLAQDTKYWVYDHEIASTWEQLRLF